MRRVRVAVKRGVERETCIVVDGGVLVVRWNQWD